MFKGNKIRLRAYRADDVKRVFELYGEEEIRDTATMAINFPISYEGRKSFVDKKLVQTNELFTFAIDLLETDECIGSCAINKLDGKNSIATIGIWIGKKYQGCGLGSEALRILCNFIFEEMNIHKIKLHYIEFNEAGKRCYEAVGFKEEGINRKELYRHGRYYDTVNMGLFKEEYKKKNL